MSIPSNLIIYTETDYQKIAQDMISNGAKSVDWTNGIFGWNYLEDGAKDKAQILMAPTILAGFQFLKDVRKGRLYLFREHKDDEIYKSARIGLENRIFIKQIKAWRKPNAMMVGINSDKSCRDIIDQAARKNNSDKELILQQKEQVAPFLERAENILVPLALQNPDTKILGIAYDEDTPNDSMRSLTDNKINITNMFKWGGYGISKDVGIIEGTELVTNIFAFPFPNSDDLPACAGLTRTEGQAKPALKIDLREVEGLHGRPYIDKNNKLLRIPTHPAIEKFTALDVVALSRALRKASGEFTL